MTVAWRRAGCLALAAALTGVWHSAQPASGAELGPAPRRPLVAVIDTGVIAAELPGSLRHQWRCARVCRAGAEPKMAHGTEVARTILATAPQALIDSYDVTDEFGAISPRAVTAAIRHAAAQGIPVINVSLAISGTQPKLQRVLARAGRSVVVAAAGNDGRRLSTSNPLQPCMSKSARVVCVTASTSLGEPAGYNYSARWVDLAAPSLAAPGPATRNHAFTGTSAAAAQVSAALAQLLAQQPCLLPAQAARQILRTVAKHPGLRPVVRSGGELDLQRALDDQPDCPRSTPTSRTR